MVAAEFQAQIVDGKIEIPYALRGQFQGDVKVILSGETTASAFENTSVATEGPPEDVGKPEYDAKVMQAARLLNHTSDEDLQRIREDLRLQDRYRGMYVAFIDVWTIRSDGRALERKILAHDASFEAMYKELEATIARLSVTRDSIRTTYVKDPIGGVNGNMSIGANL